MCKKTGWIEILGCGMVHPAVFEAVGYDARAVHRVRLGHRHRAHRDLATGSRTSGCSTRTTCGSWNSSRSEGPRLPGCAISSTCRSTPPTLAARPALAGFEVASVEPLGDRRRRDRLRGHGQPARLPQRHRPRARGRDACTGTRPQAHRLRQRSRRSRPVDARRRCAVTDRGRRALPALRRGRRRRHASARRRPGWRRGCRPPASVRSATIVDITNYVLLELGQPMHAFDLDEAGRAASCASARARAGETITTLDGAERDARRRHAGHRRPRSRRRRSPASWAAPTARCPARPRRSSFESAYFKPASVRRTSKRLGLKTEASSRFERGADIDAAVVALARACALMEQIGAGQCRATAGSTRVPSRGAGRRAFDVRACVAPACSAPTWRDDEVARILTGLGFVVDERPPTAGTCRVRRSASTSRARSISSRRSAGTTATTASDDVPGADRPAGAPDPRLAQRPRSCGGCLTAAGFPRASRSGFIERQGRAARSRTTTDLVPIANPLSAKFDTLRPSLLPGLVDAVAHNRRHGRDDVRLFELGTRFVATAAKRRALALAWTGARRRRALEREAARPSISSTSRASSRRSDDALGLTLPRSRRRACRFSCRVRPRPSSPSDCRRRARLRRGRTAAAGAGRGARRAAPGRGLRRRARPRRGRRSRRRIRRHRARRVRCRAIPSSSAISRFVVADTLPAENIRGTIRAAAPAPLVRVVVFDRYQGKGVPDGTVSLSVRLTFQAAERTLTDAEVQTRRWKPILGTRERSRRRTALTRAQSHYVSSAVRASGLPINP